MYTGREWDGTVRRQVRRDRQMVQGLSRSLASLHFMLKVVNIDFSTFFAWMHRMKTESTFDRFCSQSPFAVITQIFLRACIHDCFSQSFEQARGRQYQDVLTFENLAIAVADVALGICKNPNQAYRAHKKDLNVARSRFYDKINCTSPQLSQQIVADTAIKVAEMQDALGISLWEGIPGYRLLAIDGNHLEKTDKRLEVLRGTKVAPLPGTGVCRFDLGRQIFDRVYLLEDAHQQESATCDAIVDDLASIGHPRAALFLFSLTVISYHILQVILTALFVTHEEEEVNN